MNLAQISLDNGFGHTVLIIYVVGGLVLALSAAFPNQSNKSRAVRVALGLILTIWAGYVLLLGGWILISIYAAIVPYLLAAQGLWAMFKGDSTPQPTGPPLAPGQPAPYPMHQPLAGGAPGAPQQPGYPAPYQPYPPAQPQYPAQGQYPAQQQYPYPPQPGYPAPGQQYPAQPGQPGAPYGQPQPAGYGAPQPQYGSPQPPAAPPTELRSSRTRHRSAAVPGRGAVPRRAAGLSAVRPGQVRLGRTGGTRRGHGGRSGYPDRFRRAPRHRR